MSASNLQNLALLKFGLNVPANLREETIKLIKSNPAYKDDFENIKNNIKTMTDEDEFLEAINSSHQKICEISENSKVIQLRQKTFQIRAINPQHIKSLTERAFFNSFNLDRIVMNDLEEENKYRESQKNIKAEEYEKKKVASRNNPIDYEDQTEIKKIPNDDQEDDQAKCICGKNNQKAGWIQCVNEAKCRGSNWYHIECSGFEHKNVNIEDLANRVFTCEFCKRNPDDDEQSQSSNKKIKKI